MLVIFVTKLTIKEINMATEKLKIRDKAPNFLLPGVDGMNYSLEFFSNKELLCIIFSCNHCLYVKVYEDRIIAIQRDFQNDLQIVAINLNDELNYPEDSFEEVKKRAKEKNFNFPYLRDSDQNVANTYGSTHTQQKFFYLIEKKTSIPW